MPAPRPNIVFVVPDEFRQQAMGCMDADPVLTPNLDRFATEGIAFTHAVSNRPVCSPYRGMLFTGKYPHRNGVLTNCNSATAPYGIQLRQTDRCLTDVLHDAGYSQGYIGKLHLDSPTEEDAAYGEGRRGDGKVWDAYTPPGPRRHGIDFWHSYGCCDRHFDPHYWVNDARIDQAIEPKEWSVKHETDVAVSYIRNADGTYRDPERPFCLFVAYNPPHMPFHQVPEKYVKLYEGKTERDLLTRPNVAFDGKGAEALKHAKNYFAAVSGIDEQFGRILDALRQEGLEDDTIVIFTSDHGEMMGSQDLMHKSYWYDESFLVPFLARWPGRLQPRRDDLLISVPDLLPTLLGLCDLDQEIPDDVEGLNLARAFLGEDVERPDSALYLDTDHLHPERGRRGVRTHRYMLAIERLAEGEENVVLHDCQEDPYQLRNIAAERPEVVAELRAELDAWLVQTGDPWAGTV
jgi:arylsulfatase A-like enzyme